MHKSPQQIICSIPLSNSSVQKIDERIDEMASNVLTEQKRLV